MVSAIGVAKSSSIGAGIGGAIGTAGGALAVCLAREICRQTILERGASSGGPICFGLGFMSIISVGLGLQNGVIVGAITGAVIHAFRALRNIDLSNMDRAPTL